MVLLPPLKTLARDKKSLFSSLSHLSFHGLRTGLLSRGVAPVTVKVLSHRSQHALYSV